MKKILFLLILIGCTLPAIAQVSYSTRVPVTSSLPTPYIGNFTVKANGYDTSVNVDTSYLGWVFSGRYDFMFDVLNTKISGTVGGTAVLQMSTDNVNYLTTYGDTTQCVGCVGQTAVISNSTAHYVWAIPNGRGKYYRVRLIYSGTQTSAPTGTAFYKW